MDCNNDKANVPLPILQKSFTTSITQLITSSGLPMSVIELIILGVYSDIKKLAKEELDECIKEYKGQSNDR